MAEFDKDCLKNLEKSIVKAINEVGKKADITPSETRAVLDGFAALDRVWCQMDECQMKEQEEEAKKSSYRGYSMHGDIPYRRYNITAYGDPAAMSYGRPMMPRYSGDYGVEGWYRSGDDRHYQAGVYPMEAYGSMMHDPMDRSMTSAEHREYSRHSVNDRVISILEKSPELSNMTPFEQEQVRRLMTLIRTAE